MYFSKEFIRDICHTLAQDHEFVEMLQSVWQIELSESTIHLYRQLVMYREPLVRTDSGFHVLSTTEAITGIRAYFDPAHLSDDDAASSEEGEDSFSRRIRANILSSFRLTLDHSPLTDATGVIHSLDVQGRLLYSIWNYRYIAVSALPNDPPTVVDQLGREISFVVPFGMSEAISRASTAQDVLALTSEATSLTKLGDFLTALTALLTYLENPDAGPACECPYAYFFVKFFLDQGLGVPKLLLALYDTMNMQLSREFIRCANPNCKLNKLDKSTGKLKFKQCSRCKAVIYCSRECQVAHYPEHKRLCREHATG